MTSPTPDQQARSTVLRHDRSCQSTQSAQVGDFDRTGFAVNGQLVSVAVQSGQLTANLAVRGTRAGGVSASKVFPEGTDRTFLQGTDGAFLGGTMSIAI